jgi:hypothetical protein
LHVVADIQAPGQPISRSLSLRRGKGFFCTPKRSVRYKSHPRVFYLMGTGRCFFWGVKQQGHEADNSPPSVAELKRGVTTSFHSYNGRLSRDHHDDDCMVFTGTALHFTFLQILLG